MITVGVLTETVGRAWPSKWQVFTKGKVDGHSVREATVGQDRFDALLHSLTCNFSAHLYSLFY